MVMATALVTVVMMVAQMRTFPAASKRERKQQPAAGTLFSVQVQVWGRAMVVSTTHFYNITIITANDLGEIRPRV